MSTELIQAAAPAEPIASPAQPEPQDAGVAPQQNDAGESADQSKDSEQADSLTPEQRTIRKLESRIGRLAAKRGAAEREAELLRQQMAEFQRRTSGQNEEGEAGNVRQFSEADIERVATQKAAEMTRQKAIGERVGKVLREGEKLDGFNAAVDAVAEVVPFTDRTGKPTPFIEAVLDTDEPAALLKYLGDNPDEAEELADLTPIQLGRRLTRLEDKLKKGAKASVSAAPKPLQHLKAGNSGVSTPRTPEELMNELRSMRR